MTTPARRCAARRAFACAAVLAALVAALPACDLRDALPVPPAEVARDADRQLAADLRAHLLALPAVAGASVVVDREPVDPLARPLARPNARPPARPPRVAVALVADPSLDPARLDGVARAAIAARLGADAAVSVAILPSPARSDLARLGPFTVAASARAPLLALLAGSLLAVAALATVLAVVLARRRR